MKKSLVLMLISISLLFLFGCGKSEAVLKVEVMIDSLGTITAESESDIAAAQKAYDALSDKEKKSVSNYATLAEAITQFEEQNNLAALVVEKMIENLGEITAGSADAINEALDAYNALLPRQKELVSSTALNTLNSALDAWKAKYDFSGFYYTVQVCNVFDWTRTDVTLSKSIYASLYEDSDEVLIKLSDDMDKIIFKNQHGTYYGTVRKSSSDSYPYGIFGEDSYLRSSALNVPCTAYAITWEDVPVILEGKTLTQNKMIFFLKNGSSAGLFEMPFVLDGKNNDNPSFLGFVSYTDVMNKNSIVVDYLFEVSSTAD